MLRLEILLFGLLSFLESSSVNCKRIENDVFLRTVQNNSQLFKFYYPNYESSIQLIDHLLLDPTRQVDCANSLLRLKAALQNKEDWALKCR